MTTRAYYSDCITDFLGRTSTLSVWQAMTSPATDWR